MVPLRYIILDEPIPKDSLPLGSLVRDPQRPLYECYTPDAVLPEVLRWTRVDDHVEEVLNFASNPVERKLRRHLFSRFQDDTNKIFRLKASEAYVYGFHNPEAWLAELIKAEEVQAFTHRTPKTPFVFLVTGYRTFRNGALSFEKEEVERKVSASVSIPRSGIQAGYGGTLRAEASRQTYETKDETIFAIAYYKFNLREGFSRSSREQIKSWFKGWPGNRTKKQISKVSKIARRLPWVMDEDRPMSELADGSGFSASQGVAVARESPFRISNPTITWIEERKGIEESDGSVTDLEFDIKEAPSQRIDNNSDTESESAATNMPEPPESGIDNIVELISPAPGGSKGSQSPDTAFSRMLFIFDIRLLLLLAILINLNGILFSALADARYLSDWIATSTASALIPFIEFFSVILTPEVALICYMPQIRRFFRQVMVWLAEWNRPEIPNGYRRHEWICVRDFSLFLTALNINIYIPPFLPFQLPF